MRTRIKKANAPTLAQRVAIELQETINRELKYIADESKLLLIVEEMLPRMQAVKPHEQLHVYASAIFAAFEEELRKQHRWVDRCVARVACGMPGAKVKP
jgi:hypothetical protein